jgi:hypothetical protein
LALRLAALNLQERGVFCCWGAAVRLRNPRSVHFRESRGSVLGGKRKRDAIVVERLWVVLPHRWQLVADGTPGSNPSSLIKTKHVLSFLDASDLWEQT